MKRIDLLYLFLSLAAASFVLFLFVYSPDNDNKFTIADIKVEIRGIIKRKVAVREGLVTHVKISRYNKSDTLVFLGENIDSVNIGDNITKYKNSPFFYILRKGEPSKKLKYVLISRTIFNDENFPKNWKDSCNTTWKSVMID